MTVFTISRMKAIVQSRRNVIYWRRGAVEAIIESLYVCMYVCMYVLMYVHNIISTGSLLIVADPMVRIGLKVCMYVCTYMLRTGQQIDNSYYNAEGLRMYVYKYCMYIYVHVCTSISK